MRIHKFKLPVMALMMVCSLLAEYSSHAAVINAASCQFNDVSNAVAQASPGDTVQLPAGTDTWSETLILNGVSLNGAGTNATVLIDEENRTTTYQMISLYPVAGQLTEISNIQFQGGTTNTSINYYGAIQAVGTAGTSWRIDHNVFNGLYAKGICTYGNSFSVVDHNIFYELTISVSDNSAFPNDGEGDVSWSQPPTYGQNSSNVLYVEDNYMTNLEPYVASVGACDGAGGARIVFRYNTVCNDCFNNHGTESGGRNRSERSFEIYGNTFTCSSSAPFYPLYAAMLVRGGSGVIFSNTATGYNELLALRNYRYTLSYYSEWDPFAGADGLSPYDSNSPTLYLSGVSSGPNGSTYLQVAGANWATNQWYGYSLLDTNSELFSPVISNTVNTIYYMGGSNSTPSLVPGQVLTFNNGDNFQLHYVYAALDQPGRGSGDLLQDEGLGANGILVTIDSALGVAAWPREALEGIYCWSNTLNGAHSEETSPYPGLQEGRDFYNDTPMPGYTPFVYPHPLVGTNSLGGGGTYTNTPPNTNSPPSTNSAPLPPSNLKIIGSTN